MTGRGRASLAATALLVAVCGVGGLAPAAPGEVAGGDPAATHLRAAATIPVPGGGAIRRYRQRVGGLPVLDAGAVVADPPDGEPIVVLDRTRAGLEPLRGRTIPRRRAIRLAAALAGQGGLRAAPRARLFVEPRRGVVAWRVLVPAARPLADLEVLLDAADGRRLAVHDLLRPATGSATLFTPNPVATQSGYNGLRDRKDRDSALLTSLRRPVTLERITGVNGCLRGSYVEVRRGPRLRKVCRASLDWTEVTRSSDVFEALMAYFHVDTTRAYIDGLGLSRGLRARPQRVHVDDIPDDNSFYTPFDRRISLGHGGVDDGEDADVVVHEYGHAVQDQQVRFFGVRFEGAAMGEGFGDYLAAAMSSRVSGGNAQFDPCMFEWDATSYTKNKCLRRTDKPLTKRQAKRRCVGDPHCLGQAWSSALWELRGLLGTGPDARVAMDRVLLESHFMLDRKANFRDAARALLAADSLLYGGMHSAAISAEMVQRGFCPAAGC